MTILAESKQDYISEIWECQSVWEFKEPTDKDKSVIDGKAIIGLIEGQFFVPDGKSRNERFYPRTLWENILGSKSVRDRLDSLLMFGMIGHEDKSISEEDLRSGNVSHIISNLWIDDNNRGMGKAYILNTEAGKNLYIYLKAGAKLKTSSRARGKFVESEKKDGLPVVDTDSFFLETFDFVINPGFEETSATLMEKLGIVKRGETVMDEKSIQTSVKYLTESSEKLQSQLKTSITESANLKIENSGLLNENKSLKQKLESFNFLENVDKSVIEALNDFDESDWNALLNSKIKICGALRESSYVHNSISYDAVFIPVKSSKVPFNKFESVVKNTMNEWDRNASPVEATFIKKKDNNVFNSNGLLVLWKEGQRPRNAIDTVSKLIIESNHDLFEGYGVPLTKAFTREQEDRLNRDLHELSLYRKIGNPKEINILLDKMTEEISKYRELGTVSEVNRLVNIAEEYAKIGNSGDINECLDKLVSEISEYRELGTVNEVGELINIVEKYMEIGSPEDISETLEEAKNIVSEYLEIGSITEINSALDRVEGFLSNYSELGTVEEVSEALDQSQSVLESYLEIGTPSEINEALDIMEQYLKIGTPSEINKVLDITESYAEIGTPSEIDEVFNVVEEFSREIGTPTQIVEAMENSSKIISEYKALGTPKELKVLMDTVEQMVESGRISKDLFKGSISESSETVSDTTERLAKVFNETSKSQIGTGRNIFGGSGSLDLNEGSFKNDDSSKNETNSRVINIFSRSMLKVN